MQDNDEGKNIYKILVMFVYLANNLNDDFLIEKFSQMQFLIFLSLNYNVFINTQ